MTAPAEPRAIARPKAGAAPTQEVAPGKKAEGPMHLVMCPPTFLDNKIPNNTFMKADQPVDRKRAVAQWQDIRQVIEAFGAKVEELPATKGAQDACFVANIGIAIDPYIILANYKAPGRSVEVAPAKKFFQGMGYKTIQPPHHFEGEADLKKLNDTTFIGGYGKFSDVRAYDWIEDLTGATIIRVRETSDKLYHLDCSLMVMDEQNVLASSEGLDKPSIKAIEKVANVIPVPKGLAAAGLTNGVKIVDKRIYLSGALQTEEKSYRQAVEWLLKNMDTFGYVPVFFDTDEVSDVSGADLSCMVMHLDFVPDKKEKGKTPQGRPQLSRGAARNESPKAQTLPPADIPAV